jgi:hypothetical protein
MNRQTTVAGRSGGRRARKNRCPHSRAVLAKVRPWADAARGVRGERRAGSRLRLLRWSRPEPMVVSRGNESLAQSPLQDGSRQLQVPGGCIWTGRMPSMMLARHHLRGQPVNCIQAPSSNWLGRTRRGDVCGKFHGPSQLVDSVDIVGGMGHCAISTLSTSCEPAVFVAASVRGRRPRARELLRVAVQRIFSAVASMHATSSILHIG